MKVFVDMDGVLSNFTKGCENLFNTSLDPWPEPGEYDIHGFLNMDSTEFWMHINEAGEDFWANLEPYPYAMWILSECEELVGKNNVAILTSPTRDPACLSGKFKWIKRLFPDYERKILIGACKQMCANTNTILIDDSDKNIKKFNMSSGTGILYPRPWNSACEDRIDGHKTVIEHLRHFVRKNTW